MDGSRQEEKGQVLVRVDERPISEVMNWPSMGSYPTCGESIKDRFGWKNGHLIDRIGHAIDEADGVGADTFEEHLEGDHDRWDYFAGTELRFSEESVTFAVRVRSRYEEVVQAAVRKHGRAPQDAPSS